MRLGLMSQREIHPLHRWYYVGVDRNPISQIKILVGSFFSFIRYLLYLRTIELTLFVKFDKYILTANSN